MPGGECMDDGGKFLPDLYGHLRDGAERHLDGHAGHRTAQVPARILRCDRIEIKIRASPRLAPRDRAEEDNADEIVT